MKKNVINITKLAYEHLSNAQKSSKSKYILFSIAGGGCNRLKYNLEPNNDEPKKIDEIVKIDDLKINVCGKSLLYLLGTTIDWTSDIMGNRFIFENPNATGKCGCGTTFSV